MKTKLSVLAVIFCVLFSFTSGFAEVPQLINYQGKITNKDNKPLDGAYNITFRLFDVETGGSFIWEEPHLGTAVQKGIISTMLGSITPLNTLKFDKQYYLEIQVNNEILTPRQKIGSVAYVKRAEKADNLAIPGQQKGDILYYDGTKWIRLAAGTRGQLLQTQGSGASPTWAEPTYKNMQVFTSSGIFKKPAGVDKVFVEVVGGGGGGGGTDNAIALPAGGGGGGGYSAKICFLTGDVTITIGMGGVGGKQAAGGFNGNLGGTSSFGDFCSATGGAGGSKTGGNSDGGIGIDGDINMSGEGGSPAFWADGARRFNGRGGNSKYGYGGVSGTGQGKAGQNYGGGGAGGDAGVGNGGSGAPGVVIIKW